MGGGGRRRRRGARGSRRIRGGAAAGWGGVAAGGRVGIARGGRGRGAKVSSCVFGPLLLGGDEGGGRGEGSPAEPRGRGKTESGRARGPPARVGCQVGPADPPRGFPGLRGNLS